MSCFYGSETRTIVSVPLRGKEGAGQRALKLLGPDVVEVSVPLRGKEGAGLTSEGAHSQECVPCFRPLAG